MPELSQDLSWRPMREGDLDRVAELAVLGFPDHFEGRPVFVNRLELYRRGSFVLAAGDELPVGYLVAYPMRRETAPPLNTLMEVIPKDAEVIYLHDLALDPDVRGGGHTAAIVERLAQQAKADGWPALALVAVNDAAGFWMKRGFTTASLSGMAEKLATYGPDARYMVRPLQA
ncbi:MAG TPA: GNAT family N-acetyltransferase [Brevundimonas sp.]|jgi:GNAT superfamily N-acetyltransferase